MDDRWQWLILGVDLVSVYFFRKWYKEKVKSATEVEDAELCAISKELQERLALKQDRTIPYVCIEGKVESIDKPLRSHFKDSEEGVLQKLLFVEHKSKRTQGYWSDSKNIIRDQLNMRPFALAGDGRHQGAPMLVEVTEPLSANYLLSSLTTTYDEYEPNKSGVLSRGIDRLFGEVSKGYQETEKMLNIGVHLLGIGRLVLDDNDKMILEAPTNPDQPYVLSSLSKKEILNDLQSNAKSMRVFMWLLGLWGTALLGYIVYKNFRRFWEYLKMSRLYQEIREQRRRHQEHSQSTNGERSPSDTDSRNCVVCLENLREVVLLECGHICICADCVLVLPEPKKCPICRQHVDRYVSTYVS